MGDDKLNFKVGDYVTRISHNHDVLFKISSIDGDKVLLQGVNVRLIADATINDIVSSNNKSDDKEIIERNIKDINFDRSNYFYFKKLF